MAAGVFRNSFDDDSNAQETEILGGTDQTKIGNDGDRLKVDSQITPAPSNNILHIPEYLVDGSSPDMNVNGSGTPVQFTWSPGSGETWYLHGLHCLLIDPGTMDPTDFGSIFGGLTNGVLIEIRTNGTTYTFCNIQNNLDLSLLLSSGGQFERFGFFNHNDIFDSNRAFLPEITLRNSEGDFIRATVRDNLTSLEEFRMAAYKWRTI